MNFSRAQKCESEADFVNHFFPSLEKRERGWFCKSFFPDPRNEREVGFVNHFFPSLEMR